MWKMENNGILTPIKAIRSHCLDCMCGQATEVRLCPITDCSLWPYRMGHNPSRKGKGGNPANFAQKSTAQVEESDDVEIEETQYTALDDEKISAAEGEEMNESP